MNITSMIRKRESMPTTMSISPNHIAIPMIIRNSIINIEFS